MPKLEVFFDYSCEYCKSGHEYLRDIIEDFPDIEIDWKPCEAHPRPEEYGRHSDLCARGMYFARDFGVDVDEYHKRMYHAAVNERDKVNVDDPAAVAGVVADLCSADKFIEALKSEKYVDTLDENNNLVWDVYECPAVPSFRVSGSGKLLKSVPRIGVTKDMLEEFLRKETGR